MQYSSIVVSVDFGSGVQLQSLSIDVDPILVNDWRIHVLLIRVLSSHTPVLYNTTISSKKTRPIGTLEI